MLPKKNNTLRFWTDNDQKLGAVLTYLHLKVDKLPLIISVKFLDFDNDRPCGTEVEFDEKFDVLKANHTDNDFYLVAINAQIPGPSKVRSFHSHCWI